ncbi:MAG TPA: glycosyltransferase [Vicinamibacterales bacterium]|nr:glycosyltransferase [Vicinamibacterales bacterium]
MRVLHVSYSWLPAPPGGTEIYVDRLMRDLDGLGVESVVAAPAATGGGDTIDGRRVYRFQASGEDSTIESLYGGDAAAAAKFAAVLDEVAPDVLHQHAFSPACSSALIQMARARGIATVFTYHTPTASCVRGTLMQWGTRQCDGLMEPKACTKCVLQRHGVPKTLARLAGVVPAVIAAGAARRGLSGGVWTSLRMRRLVESYQRDVRRLLMNADRIVVLTDWVGELLRRNGVSSDRLVACAHGVPAAPPLPPRTSGGRTRLVHLGRLDPVKGTALLLMAMRNAPDAAVDLDVFGVVQDAAATGEFNRLAQLAAGDARIRLLPAIPHADVEATLARYDAVVVPSQWMETGPLVVLEAFAAGVPVIGSNLGGIADKVLHGHNGLLVSPWDAEQAWSDVLRHAGDRRVLLRQFARGVATPRSSAAVAADMAGLYRTLRAHGAEATAPAAESIR